MKNKGKLIDTMDFHFSIKPFSIKILFFLFLFISTFSYAQKSKEEKEIDAKIEKADEYNGNIKIKELLQISQDILSKSEKIDYEKGLAYGHYFRAWVLYYTGNYKKSLSYVNKAQTDNKYSETNPVFQAMTYHLLGANYNRLELYSLASKNIYKSIDILNKIKANNKKLLNLDMNYTELSYLYSNLEKSDSVYYILIKQRQVLDKIKSKDAFRHKILSDINLGNYFYMEEKDDSARYYYTKALSVLDGKNHEYKIGAVLGLGGVDFEKNKLDDALGNYLQAIELVKKGKLSLGLSEAYQGLEMVYEKKGDFKKAREYKELYQKINDSVAITKKLQRDSIINQVIQFEKEEQEEESNKKFIKIASVVGLIIILSSIAIFYFIRRKRKELIEEKETIIYQKEEENQDLKQKVNESFDEVVQMAKENSIEFFTRFREVYPHLISRLLELDSKLRVSELSLCAYYFLGFSTKDIATYTFKSIHTIRNRRQNLRTKFGIPADESIELWLKKL